MYQQPYPSRPGKVLFWSLVILAIVMIAVVLFALRRFNRDIANDVSEADTEMAALKNAALAMPVPDTNENRDTYGFFTLTGFVSEVAIQKKAGGKAIVLSTVILDEATGSPKNASYRFFLSDKDTAGATGIQGGESVTIHFSGSPSETSSIVAKAVEKNK